MVLSVLSWCYTKIHSSVGKRFLPCLSSLKFTLKTKGNKCCCFFKIHRKKSEVKYQVHFPVKSCWNTLNKRPMGHNDHMRNQFKINKFSEKYDYIKTLIWRGEKQLNCPSVSWEEVLKISSRYFRYFVIISP